MWPGQEVISWEAKTSGQGFTSLAAPDQVEPEGDSPRGQLAQQWPALGRPHAGGLLISTRTAQLTKQG